MENFGFEMIFNCVLIFLAIIGTLLFAVGFAAQEVRRNRVPRFRKKLIEVLNDYGIKNELKDEVLYLTRRGFNVSCHFGVGLDKAVNVLITSTYELDFNIDWVGELVIERYVNDNLGNGGKSRFVDKKMLSIVYVTSIHKVDSLMGELDYYIDTVRAILDKLSEARQRLEEDFGERNEQSNTRKIGF